MIIEKLYHQAISYFLLSLSSFAHMLNFVCNSDLYLYLFSFRSFTTFSLSSLVFSRAMFSLSWFLCL